MTSKHFQKDGHNPAVYFRFVVRVILSDPDPYRIRPWILKRGLYVFKKNKNNCKLCAVDTACLSGRQ